MFGEKNLTNMKRMPVTTSWWSFIRIDFKKSYLNVSELGLAHLTSFAIILGLIISPFQCEITNTNKIIM